MLLFRATLGKGSAMKKALCALALAVVWIGFGASVAQADTPRCVTKREYRHVHSGMGRAHVHRVFDIRGRRVAYASAGSYTSQVRSYRGCHHRGAVSVSYLNGKVTAKAAVWAH